MPNRGAMLLEDLDPLLVAPGDPGYRLVAGGLLRSPVHQGLPKAGSAHGEADEPGYRSCHREPLAHLLVVLPSTEDDAADFIAAIPSSCSYNPFTVFAAVNPL